MFAGTGIVNARYFRSNHSKAWVIASRPSCVIGAPWAVSTPKVGHAIMRCTEVRAICRLRNDIRNLRGTVGLVAVSKSSFATMDRHPLNQPGSKCWIRSVKIAVRLWMEEDDFRRDTVSLHHDLIDLTRPFLSRCVLKVMIPLQVRPFGAQRRHGI